MMDEMINKVVWGDAMNVLDSIGDNTIAIVLTDPPYFLDKMDNNWNHKTVSTVTDYCHTVKSLPPGMKFDREQGKRFYTWCCCGKEIRKKIYRDWQQS